MVRVAFCLSKASMDEWERRLASEGLSKPFRANGSSDTPKLIEAIREGRDSVVNAQQLFTGWKFPEGVDVETILDDDLSSNPAHHALRAQIEGRRPYHAGHSDLRANSIDRTGQPFVEMLIADSPFRNRRADQKLGSALFEAVERNNSRDMPGLAIIAVNPHEAYAIADARGAKAFCDYPLKAGEINEALADGETVVLNGALLRDVLLSRLDGKFELTPAAVHDPVDAANLLSGFVNLEKRLEGAGPAGPVPG